jgi:hypothetical protein
MLTNNADQKVIRIHGYKALLTKNTGQPGEKPNYQIQMPLQSSMIMIDAPEKLRNKSQRLRKDCPWLKLPN